MHIELYNMKASKNTKHIILSFLGVLFFFLSFAQNNPSRNQLQQNNAVGYSYKSGEFRIMLYIPQDTLATQDSGAIAYLNEKFYIKQQEHWDEFKRVQQVDDSSFVIGKDTIVVRGIGGLVEVNLDTARNDIQFEILNTAGTSAIIPVATTELVGLLSAADKVKLNRLVWNSDSVRYFIQTDTGLTSLAYRTDIPESIIPTLQQVLDAGSVTNKNNSIDIGSYTYGFTNGMGASKTLQFPSPAVAWEDILGASVGRLRVLSAYGGVTLNAGQYTSDLSINSPNSSGVTLSSGEPFPFLRSTNSLSQRELRMVGDSAWTFVGDRFRYDYNDSLLRKIYEDSLSIPYWGMTKQFVKDILKDSITVQAILDHPLNGTFRYDSNIVRVPVHRRGIQSWEYPEPSFDRGFINGSTNRLTGNIPEFDYWLSRGGNMMKYDDRYFDESNDDTALQNWNPVYNILQTYRFKNNGQSKFERDSARTWQAQLSGFGADVRIHPPKKMDMAVDPNGGNPNAFHGSLSVGRDSAYDIFLYSNPNNYPIPVSVYGAQIDFDRSGTNRQRIINSNGYGIAGYISYWKNRQGGNFNASRGSYIGQAGGYVAVGSMYVRPFGSQTTIKDSILVRSTVDTVYGFKAQPQWRVLNEVKNGIGFWSEGTNDNNIFQGRLTVGTMDLTQREKFLVNGISKFNDSVRLLAVPTNTYEGQYLLGLAADNTVIKLDANELPGGSLTDYTTIGTTGTSPNWSFSGGKYLLSMPDAGTGITRGLINNTTQDIRGNKSFREHIGVASGVMTNTRISIGAGTSSVAVMGWAPGTLLNTITNDKWEYNGENIYFTIGGKRHQIDRQHTLIPNDRINYIISSPLDEPYELELSEMVGFRVRVFRNGIKITTIDTQPTYYTWDSGTGLLTIYPYVTINDIIQVEAY